MSAPLDDIASYSAWVASTFPHHKHILPNLRDHRVAAPGIRFEAPNLDVVLEDVRREWLQP
jgi:hypothetical protein